MFDPRDCTLHCDAPGCDSHIAIPAITPCHDQDDVGFPRNPADMASSGASFLSAMQYAEERDWTVEAGMTYCDKHRHVVICNCVHGTVKCCEQIVVHALTELELSVKLSSHGWQKLSGGNWGCRYAEPVRALNVSPFHVASLEGGAGSN